MTRLESRLWPADTAPQQRYVYDVDLTSAAITDADGAARLAGMVRRCTDRWHHNGHALDPDTADTIIAGLHLCATVANRRDALKAVAAEVDWSGTVQGRREVAALVAWIAPDCTRQVWRRVVEEAEQAYDSTLTYMARRAAEGNLLAALAEAVPAQTAPAPTSPEAA